MDVLDDAAGEFVNKFNVVDENLGGLFSNMTLLSMLLLSLKDKPFPKTKNTFNKTYDYIIVGGGTAGCVMANRLSELPCVSVLLLEAGGYAPLISEIPAYMRILHGTNVDWAYTTTPQKYAAFAQNEQRITWISGKVLGGSSVINGMIYARANKKNYDDWEKEGCTGWGYDHVKKYFLKLEDNRDIENLDEGYHQQGGLMTVETPKFKSEIKDALLESTAALGYVVRDVNGRRQTGVYEQQGTLRNGQRCSTAKAYLVPAEDRPNLTILKRAFAKKILIRNKKAIGVEFDFEGRHSVVYANMEVIISSGTARAPQILMLSGIGPKKHLEKLGIPVVADLPVGKNLQEHYGINLNYEVSPTIPNVVVQQVNPVNIFNYITKREGPLSTTGGASLVAFMYGLNTTEDSPDFPRQEMYFADYNPLDALKNFNLKPGVYEKFYAKYTLSTSYTCISSLLQPHSRGEILLNSKNPYEQPLINPNYYCDERDVWTVVEGMKICQAIGTSKEMKKIKSKPYDRVFPGCENTTANETEYFACMAKHVIMSFFHPAGTCRMGQPDDCRSVVDPQLRVIGVEGLRVVCAAVMPIIPSGNPNVPIMMVAEKIADEMKMSINCDNR